MDSKSHLMISYTFQKRNPFVAIFDKNYEIYIDPYVEDRNSVHCRKDKRTV